MHTHRHTHTRAHTHHTHALLAHAYIRTGTAVDVFKWIEPLAIVSMADQHLYVRE